MEMEKIQMKTPLVEMDGDEMTRILWQMIKDELLIPFIDLKTECRSKMCDNHTKRSQNDRVQFKGDVEES